MLHILSSSQICQLLRFHPPFGRLVIYKCIKHLFHKTNTLLVSLNFLFKFFSFRPMMFFSVRHNMTVHYKHFRRANKVSWQVHMLKFLVNRGRETTYTSAGEVEVSPFMRSLLPLTPSHRDNTSYTGDSCKHTTCRN